MALFNDAALVASAVTSGKQLTPAERAALAKQEQIAAGKAHAAALLKQDEFRGALAKLVPYWGKLPMSPYPPVGDVSGFPRSGDPSLMINVASISKAQLAEPANAVKGLYAQAEARRPKPNALFWVGAVALVTAYFIYRD